MFRTTLLTLLVLGFASPLCAQQEPAKGTYTIDEYVEARRPVITERKLTREERTEANRLISAINSLLDKEELVPADLLEQLAPLAETGDRKAMRAMMLGYGYARAVNPMPADAIDITSSEPNHKLAGLWGMMLWIAGDHSKETSRAIDGCQDGRGPPPGYCGYTITARDDFRDPFKQHWAYGDRAPRDVVFTEHSLRPTPEQEKRRFDTFVTNLRNGEEYTGPEYLWAEVWANRAGGEYPAMLEQASRDGQYNYVARDAQRIVNAEIEHNEMAAKWEELQTRRQQARADGGALSTEEENDWIGLSHRLGGTYLVPFASENVLTSAIAIDSLCSGDDGEVCQRQRQLYQYRVEAGRSEQNMREARLRNMTLGGGDVSVRTYDSSGNYMGTTTMPAWQADVIGAQ